MIDWWTWPQELPLYWYVARAMREGSDEDARFMFEDNTLVWC